MLAHIDSLLTALGNEALQVVDLEQERSTDGAWHPVQHPGFHFGLHRQHEVGASRRTSASGVIVTVEHFGTHVDALCHQAYQGKMFGGLEVSPEVQTDSGFTVHGAETIEPIISRGVLIDVARVKGPLRRRQLLEADDLKSVLEQQDCRVRQGDVVLVRTGWGQYWEVANDRYVEGPGIAASGSQWLAECGVRAVGADNMAWDVVGHVDEEFGDFPGHVELLVRKGIYIFENLNLEDLSRTHACEFLFIAAPLKLRGATAGPVRPLALAPRK